MPDTVMVRAPVLDTPASFTSSERANLAASIARFDQLSAHLTDVRQRASAGIDAKVTGAYNERAAAEANLREAEQHASSQALARALGDEAGSSVRQARDDLATARQRFDEAHADRELVQAEIERLARAVDNARQARDAALGAVLSGAPGWAALMAELPAARRRVMQLENLFDALGRLGAPLPPHWDTPALRSRPQDWEPNPDLLALWRDAIGALQTDANAYLPGDPAPDAKAA
jgi:hypothetical protein